MAAMPSFMMCCTILFSFIACAVAQSSSSAGTPSHSGLPPLPTPTGGNFGTEYKLYGWNNCDAGQQQAVPDALAEKHAIMGTDSVFHVNWHHQGIVEYFGSVQLSLLPSSKWKMVHG